MKTYALFAALCFFVFSPSAAKIRNGYATGIESARGSLNSLKILLKDDKSLSVFQRISINNKINNLADFITYYELTEQLLEQFRTISPELYFEIDSLKDRLGRNLDVYVKFVPEKEMPAGVAGTTTMKQDEKDPDACASEYGTHTISVTVAVVKNSLPLLAHEFGHVRYQAPNLVAYLEFYREFYLANTYKSKSMGHNDNDPSGKDAREFSRTFRENYLQFLKLDRKKYASNMVLLQQIKDEVLQ